MGLSDLFMSQKRKEELLLLQKTVVENSPDKLIYSEKQLKALAYIGKICFFFWRVPDKGFQHPYEGKTGVYT